MAAVAPADEEPAAPSEQPSQASSEKQPSAKICSSIPALQDSLLRQTQAANLILSTEGPNSLHAESNAPGSRSPEADLGCFPEASETLGSFPGFPAAEGGLHGDVVRLSILHLSHSLRKHILSVLMVFMPCSLLIFQPVKDQCLVHVQDCDADLRELLHKLQGDDSCSDEERDDRSRLEALVAAVASQPNAHRRLSQALSQMVRHTTTLVPREADLKL